MQVQVLIYAEYTSSDCSCVLVEQYRLGYPRLAAFLTLDKDFSVLKRFDYLHMRSLLELQDQLSELETRLNHYDDLERIQLGLSSRRQDPNTDRRDLLHIIQTKLETYGTSILSDGKPVWYLMRDSVAVADKAVQDYNNILQLPEAQTGQLQSVQNWVLGNKPLVRSESLCFIETLSARDHIALGRDKSDRAGLEVLVDLAAKSFPGIARRVSHSLQQALSTAEHWN